MVETKSCPLSQAIRSAYREGSEDETLQPLILVGEDGIPIGRIKKGDSVIFYNIRGEREIELTRSLTENHFSEFAVAPDLELAYATMIEYQRGLPVAVAFPPEETVEATMSDLIAGVGFKQVKITEAEKAVHVGYFLNGKRQEPFPGEDRIIVPTRKDVALFDEAPEMSIGEIAEKVVNAVHDDRYAFVFANFPNVDVVGHIENEGAILQAIEAVDHHAGVVIDAALAEGMTIVVSADHGTVEKWLYPDGAVDTGHTDSPVPFVLIAPGSQWTLRKNGELADVAPTVLQLLGVAPSPLMTGQSLIENRSNPHGGVEEKQGGKARVLYLLLDGWGFQESKTGNLISQAKTPVMDRLMAEYPYAVLEAAGEAVGLPPGTVGNSEAGHLHIGAGRRIYSDRVRIDRAIADGSFFDNKAFLGVMTAARENKAALHLMGIVSFFSSHGSLHHLYALLEMAKKEGATEVYIHAMLGRRGEQPESGALYIEKVARQCELLGLGRVVSVIGRYWSMDREENWDRIEKTYRMLVYGEGKAVST